MTKAELIDLLADYPDHWEVMYDYEEWSLFEIEGVELEGDRIILF